MSRERARAKVSGDSVNNRGDVNCLHARLSTDALKSVGNTIQTVEVATHVRYGIRNARIHRRPFFEQLEPANETRERCTKLMGGFTRHPSPHVLSRGVVARSYDVHPGEE